MAATRGPAAKALDDARIAAGLKVLFLADRALVPYERMRNALRGQGALSMDELDRVMAVLGLALAKAE